MFRHFALYFVKTSRLLHIALALAAIGLTLGVGTQRQSSGWNWKPVDMPLPLNGPVRLDVPFTTNTLFPQGYNVRFAPYNGMDYKDSVEETKPEPGQELQFRVDMDGQPHHIKLRPYVHTGYDNASEHGCIAMLPHVPPGCRCVLHISAPPVPADLRTQNLHLRVDALMDGYRMQSILAGGAMLTLGVVLLVIAIVMTLRAVWIGTGEYRALLPCNSNAASPPAS